MLQETLKSGEGVAEITVIDNIIYIRVLHAHNNDLAMGVIRYIDKIIDQMPSNLIRVWDASGISSESFHLSIECINKVIAWSQGIKKKKPGSKVYFIAPEPLSYGISRMYQIQTSDDKMDVIVLKDIEELPGEIREKIPA